VCHRAAPGQPLFFQGLQFFGPNPDSSVPRRVGLCVCSFGGLIVITLQVTDRLGHLVDIHVPPIGLAASLVYLYIISQTIVRYRIVDLYEMRGRLALMTAMGALLAFIYSALVLRALRRYPERPVPCTLS
jgi:hypothetical protein